MTDHIFELLPWYINGRLSAEDRAKVTQHLQHCAQCASELDMHRRVQSAITAPAKVEIAPQTSFNKLWDRIAAAEDAEFSDATGRSDALMLSLRTLPRDVGVWFRSHWMSVALSLQTAVIIALASAVVWQHQETRNDVYRTVTSTTVNGTVIHVVFDDATRLADIKDILLRSNLQVSSGPTAAGVYSLTSINGQVSALQTVKSLRDDPRVRFAEVSHE